MLTRLEWHANFKRKETNQRATAQRLEETIGGRSGQRHDSGRDRERRDRLELMNNGRSVPAHDPKKGKSGQGNRQRTTGPASDGQKRTPCTFFAAGKCQRGTNCPFLHKLDKALPAPEGESGSRSLGGSGGASGGGAPSVAGSQRSHAGSTGGTQQICRDFQNGSCKRANCRFLHVEASAGMPSRPWVACRKFMEEGSCSHGTKCKDALARKNGGNAPARQRSNSRESNRSFAGSSRTQRSFRSSGYGRDRGRPRQRSTSTRGHSPVRRDRSGSSGSRRTFSSAGSRTPGRAACAVLGCGSSAGWCSRSASAVSHLAAGEDEYWADCSAEGYDLNLGCDGFGERPPAEPSFSEDRSADLRAWLGTDPTEQEADIMNCIMGQLRECANGSSDDEDLEWICVPAVSPTSNQDWHGGIGVFLFVGASDRVVA